MLAAAQLILYCVLYKMYIYHITNFFALVEPVEIWNCLSNNIAQITTYSVMDDGFAALFMGVVFDLELAEIFLCNQLLFFTILSKKLLHLFEYTQVPWQISIEVWFICCGIPIL